MKKLLSIVTLGAVALALPTSGFAAAKKEKPEAAPGAPASEAKKSDEKAAKPIGMYVKVDAIDAAGKTFTHKNKDGKEVKFVVTDKTEIKNGDAAAKFGDIKVGDTVNGSRLKKSDTEYDVVKITKFGVAPEKKEKKTAEKPAEKPAEPKKQ